jgi:hypothetical protein
LVVKNGSKARAITSGVMPVPVSETHSDRFTVETANRWLDERAARMRDLPPGQYLSLCVSDTGVMARQVEAHGRALVRLGIDPHLPAGLAHEAVDHGSTSAPRGCATCRRASTCRCASPTPAPA